MGFSAVHMVAALAGCRKALVGTDLAIQHVAPFLEGYDSKNHEYYYSPNKLDFQERHVGVGAD